METDRCKIVKLHKDDYEDIRALYFDEKVRAFLGGIISDERFDHSFSSMIHSDKDSFYWVIRLKDNNQFMGLVSLDPHHNGLDTEISYQFMPRWWGYGYGEEVVGQIIAYAFDELKLERLVAETQSANKNSCKLLEKIGMSLEQTITRFGAQKNICSISRRTFDMEH